MSDRERQEIDKSKYQLAGKTNTLNLDYNLAGLLCYLPIPPINVAASVLWLVTEPKSNLFLRFHAAQSLLIFVAFIVVTMVATFVASLGGIPVIGGLFGFLGGILSFLAGAAWFFGSIILLLKTNERETIKLPFVGDIAEAYSGTGGVD